jgi:hypothetical protein
VRGEHGACFHRMKHNPLLLTMTDDGIRVLRYVCQKHCDAQGLENVLNVALVVVGARVAARLDASGEMSSEMRQNHFKRIKECLRRHKHIEMVMDKSEPLVVDTSRPGTKRALEIVKKFYKPGFSDLDEPLVGAMGKLLGYGCPHPWSKGSYKYAGECPSAEMSVSVKGPRDKHSTYQIAGVMCDTAPEASAALNKFAKACLLASESSLLGAQIKTPFGTYTIEGFRACMNIK